MDETIKEDRKSVEKMRNYRLNIRVNEIFQITIFKPLLSTKISLLLWFSAASSLYTFLTLLLKQRGLKLEEILLTFALPNLLQIFTNGAVGVLVDKRGNSKQLLIFKLILTAVLALCLIELPIANTSNTKFNLYCEKENRILFKVKSVCGIVENSKYENSCKAICPDFHSYEINGECKTSETFPSKLYLNRTFSIIVNDSQQDTDQCLYKGYIIHHDNQSRGCTNSSSWDLLCEIVCETGNYTHEQVVITNRTWKVLMYFIVMCFLFWSSECVFRLFDMISMDITKEHDVDYGEMRRWCIFGSMVVPYSVGLIVEASTSNEKERNYVSAMYIFIVLCIMSAVAVFVIPVRRKQPAKKMWKASITLLRNPDVLLFALVVFVLGWTWGFLIGFKNLYLEELGVQPNMIGFISTFQYVCGLTFLLKSKWFLDNIGARNVFILSLLGYAIFCLGYSFLQDVWPAILLEVSSSLSLHLLWVAVLKFCYDVAPQELTATMCAFAGALHFCIGRACGSLLGGLIMKHFGGRIAFKVFSAINLISAVLYGSYLLYRSSRNVLEQIV